MWTQSDTRHTLRIHPKGLTLCRTLGLVFRFVEHTPSERTAGAVRAEMARRKITGRELAKGLGWSVTTTWRRLNGSHPFNVDELAAVADYLGVPLAALLPQQEAA